MFNFIPWHILGALFFLIPAMFYLGSSLFDPNGIYWPRTIVVGMPAGEYSVMMCGIAAVLYIFDAVLYICGRYSIRWQIPPEDWLIVLQAWKLKGIFEFDWELMADWSFFAGGFVGCHAQFRPYNATEDYTVEIFWIFNVPVMYIASGQHK